MSTIAKTSNSHRPILSVENLSVSFVLEDGVVVDAVDDLNFSIAPGQTLALVGESGSGKSVSSMAIMRLLDYSPAQIRSGEIIYRPEPGQEFNLLQLDKSQIRQIRGRRIAMIYQEPMTSLNPVLTIGQQMVEVLRMHLNLSQHQANERAIHWLSKVRLPDAKAMLQRYPHELSGGMRQRVMIAMALCCEPNLLIADEPTTALDVTIQAQILQIIRQLQEEMNMAVLFITHDMGVVAQMANDVIVMRKGQVLERGPVQQLFSCPDHPYTKALLNAVPQIGSMKGQQGPSYFTLLDEHEANDNLPKLKEPDWQEPLLELTDVTTRFTVKKTWWGKPTHQVFASEKVSLTVYPGETLALVGESGSGKSTVGKMIQQLLPIQQGDMFYQGRSFQAMNKAEKVALQREIQYIFQDHFASLNPRRTIFASIAEPMTTHHLVAGKANVKRRVIQLLEQVGLDESYAQRYAHELSGGQRARVCIARALALEPKLLIADESIAALDVSIQAQILNLLMALQAKLGLACLFITHDMAVVEKISHRVAVLYLGQIVEYGHREDIFENPQHPYTRKLLSAVPVADPKYKPALLAINEDIPSPVRSVNNPPVAQALQAVSKHHWVVSHQQKDLDHAQNISHGS
ncbi:ABC transporter ATP-binding protein [Celerinatantimonas diazotrophica]|uniref:Glutathione import ATP-binding protein GsiA n=1 Tax=Celerinatantimonas diazotrophica TaxID=412034 RepID=A0A4R1KBM2_9GAMM|nr:ABC transporter ATP-binding protein [Celerinatantimonas diazotrophica]TCK61487.1 glutathione transport system ATP-binding protein [Celerinatantimonas diazotrophica]CAG9296950.1 Glutathione import ATP-binding protein GsiA [Celerinatantimonas diazotrophica]